MHGFRCGCVSGGVVGVVRLGVGGWLGEWVVGEAGMDLFPPAPAALVFLCFFFFFFRSP